MLCIRCSYLKNIVTLRMHDITFLYTVLGPGNMQIPYGEVNSVKNTTINIWLNDGVY